MTTVQMQSEYCDMTIDWLVGSPTNPRKTFDEDGMNELAASIRGTIPIGRHLEGRLSTGQRMSLSAADKS